MRGFLGPFGVFVRSYAFIRAYGPQLREMSEAAVLNANYLLARLRDAYELPFERLCMHEFVLSARRQKREHGGDTNSGTFAQCSDCETKTAHHSTLPRSNEHIRRC